MTVVPYEMVAGPAKLDEYLAEHYNVENFDIKQENLLIMPWMTKLSLALTRHEHAVFVSILKKTFSSVRSPRYRDLPIMQSSLLSDRHMVGSISVPNYMLPDADLPVPEDENDVVYTHSSNVYLGDFSVTLAEIVDGFVSTYCTRKDFEEFCTLTKQFFDPCYADLDQLFTQILENVQFFGDDAQ